MAERKEIIVRATAREGRGKNDARRARRDGQVPVTIYGGAGEAVAALAPLRELAAILRSDTGRNTIFTVDIEGVEATEVMFVDRQIDPGQPLPLRRLDRALRRVLLVCRCRVR
jgi:large subunit ribosomal protein L25